VTGGSYFERPLDSVIAELKTIPERDIYIVDDNFLVSRQRVLEFCQRLEDAGINKRFLIYGRADFIAQNRDVVSRFKDVGLRAVIVGLESCVGGELDSYKKNSDVQTNECAVQVLAENSVDCYATLILGMDWSESEFTNLGRWLRKLKLTFVNLQPFTPLPGTEMLARYQSRLIVPRSCYEKWDLAHLVLAPEKMSVSRYYWNIIKLYRRVTMRPVNLMRLMCRHGVAANVRMLAGSTRVTLQYLKKVVRNWRGNGA